MGAKVLQFDARARPLKSVDAELNRISGEGRAVLTASGPTQPAWESSRFGHGFLTFYLLEALQGPAEIREGDRIGLLRLLDNVSRRVADAADEQHPAIRGTFDGEYSWPVMSPGPTYQAAFPEYGTPVTAADIASLAAFGFPQAVVDAWAGNIPNLNRSSA
jgi:hypothetical protein